jgi:magnesium-transporting ATPase (P-type)
MGVLIVVIFGTATLTFSQQVQSARVMDGFSEMMSLKVDVVRNGGVKTYVIYYIEYLANYYRIDPKYLVVGDIVKLGSGDIVPADLLVLKCEGLKVSYTI